MSQSPVISVPIVCPVCHGLLYRDRDQTLQCCQCAAVYPSRASVDVLLTEEEWDEYLKEWERERNFLEQYSTARRKSLLAIMYYDMWATRMFIAPSAGTAIRPSR
jgi:uncharacterized protein YbaR (Trm112 family)